MNSRRIVLREQTAVYHVISKTAYGRFSFDDSDKEQFRKMLMRQAAFAGVEVLTFCVLSNHFHLLVRVPLAPESLTDSQLVERYRSLYPTPALTPLSALSIKEVELTLASDDSKASTLRESLLARMHDLSVFVKELKHRFSVWYNRKHENKGTLWSERFKSILVENDPKTLCLVAAYIDLNPVRAGICQDPKEYRFCGYALALAGNRIFRNGLSQVLGLDDGAEALARYRSLLFGRVGTKTNKGRTLSEEEIFEVLCNNGELPLHERLRLRIRYFVDGGILGSKQFIDDWFTTNRSRFGPKRISGSRKMAGGDWGGVCTLRDLKKSVFSYWLGAHETQRNQT